MKPESGGSKWGYGVAAIVGSFVIFMLSLVIYASFQEIQLVEVGYYERAINYQDQIDRRDRSRELVNGLKIVHRIDKSQVVISLDQSGASQAEGTIKMIRPSNARLDRRWPLGLNESGRQVLSTSGMARGLWRIEIEWSLDSTGFFDETRIVIP